jgi:DNA (cytosine-5)-methyltransferase 1
MRYGSVCSGIEAATVAWHPLGWKAAWYSEIEPFPCAVLKHHYPAVPNYGDMTKYEEWSNEPINLLVGGTPCQSFSVAGLRKGLADPRGNLMLTYGAIARRYRPEWLVWENVPGVLSSNGGRDFGTFLGMLAELGYGFAYRVLDAQYFGVAQRRRRVFVVANARSWQRAAAVLFESHSLQGHPAPSREARQGTSRNTRGGVELCGPLCANDYKGPGTDGMNHNSAKMVPVAYPMHGGMIGRQEQNGPSGSGFGEETDPSYTLTAGGQVRHGVATSMQVRRLTPVECERLQGFPDGYTNIPWRKKPESPDGPRYKAMGNSMAVPVMHWIGKRIAAVDAL